MGNEAFCAYRPDLMVRLATEGDSSYVGEGIFETTAAAQTQSQAAFSGVPAQFRLLVRNAGDQPDSFVLTGPGGGSGFEVGYLDAGGVEQVAAISGAGYRTPILPPGEGATLLVRVNLTQFVLGASYRVAVSTVSAGDPSAVDQVKTETVACGLTSALTVSAPPDGAANPASVVNYPYSVTNVGNAGNNFALSLQMGSGWQGELIADDGAGGGTAGDGVRQAGENTPCASTGVLAPGVFYRLFAAVTVPPGASDGARGNARLEAAGGGASGADEVATTALAAAVTVGEGVRNLTRGGTFAAAVDAYPGDLLQYRMSVTNSGSAPAASVSIDSTIPPALEPVPGSFLLSLSPEAGAPCPSTQCGQVSATQTSLSARLGEEASDTAGGMVAPGLTLYLFFKAHVK